MTDQDNNQVDYTELKLPEDSFFSAEPTTSTISVRTVILILLVVFLIAILASLLWWGYQLQQQASTLPLSAERPTAAMNNEPESTTAEAELEAMSALSPSDELDAIANDLAATENVDFTRELNAIAAELAR
jgi:cytoskeletal protein RodZ